MGIELQVAWIFADIDIEIGDIDPELIELNPNFALDASDSKKRRLIGLGGVLDFSFNQFIAMRFEFIHLLKGTQLETDDPIGNSIK